MANNRLSDGVGKKIVEALKKQSEIEINPISSGETQEDFETLTDDVSDIFGTESDDEQNTFQDEDYLEKAPSDDYLDSLSSNENDILTETEFSSSPEEATTQPGQSFNYQASTPKMQDNFINELDNFEIPSNIAVLKKLITQLPSGVSRHTGAQIIKQTMEALGISMKNVLQEAQQVQDGLNTSAKECHSTIQEYKKQIKTLEKQAQNYQKQYSAINELISLFIQTGI